MERLKFKKRTSSEGFTELEYGCIFSAGPHGSYNAFITEVIGLRLDFCVITDQDQYTSFMNCDDSFLKILSLTVYAQNMWMRWMRYEPKPV
jgi:hypothetical protein